jgi:hypothetical protein
VLKKAAKTHIVIDIAAKILAASYFSAIKKPVHCGTGPVLYHDFLQEKSVIRSCSRS